MTLLKKIFIISIVTLVLGLIGYFIFSNHWIKYIFVHIGAVGIIGLLAYLTSIIAKQKGLNYGKAFSFSFFPSVFLGIISAYLAGPPRENGLPLFCGGSVSLGLALIVVIIYLLLKKRKQLNK
ncbi:hypothetical protein ACFLSE_02995 [Bacteroidota bacterium]